MVRGFLSFGGILFTAGVALLTGLQKSGRLDVSGIFTPLPEVDAAFQRGFRSDAISNINRIRVPAGVSEVGGDESLQDYLERWIVAQAKPQEIELDDVFDALQAQFPGAQYLAANLVTSRNRENLLNKLVGWNATVNSDFDSINTMVFRAGSRLGALGVMSRCIPEFSLAAANGKGGRFHNRCPHCNVIHAIELDRESRTLILSCPHCDLPFDVIAAGTGGRMRRAMDFFEGFSLKLPPNQERASPEDQIVALWSLVSDQCEYQLDQDRVSSDPKDDHYEVWKTSSETWNEAAGDCEDTSILLADVLMSAGFDARVAIGWNGNVGQHAWVVVKTEETQYLIETTLQKKISRQDLKEITEVSAFYQPEQLFDREHIYYTTARPDRFGVDYFSSNVWKMVPSKSLPSLSKR